MTKSNNRKAEIAFDKIIIIVLVIIVIIGVIYFIFRADILSYLRNLPGYQPEGDKFIKDVGTDPVLLNKVCPGIKEKLDSGKLITQGHEFYWVDNKGFYEGSNLVASENGNYLKVLNGGIGLDQYNGYLIVRAGGILYLCKG